MSQPIGLDRERSFNFREDADRLKLHTKRFAWAPNDVTFAAGRQPAIDSMCDSRARRNRGPVVPQVSGAPFTHEPASSCTACRPATTDRILCFAWKFSVHARRQDTQPSPSGWS